MPGSLRPRFARRVGRARKPCAAVRATGPPPPRFDALARWPAADFRGPASGATGSRGAVSSAAIAGRTQRRRRDRAFRRSRHPLTRMRVNQASNGNSLAVAGDVRKHFDEGVLYRFIRVMHVPQVVVRNAGCAALLEGDEAGEPFPGRVPLSSHDERLDFGRQRGIFRQRRRSGAAGGLRR